MPRPRCARGPPVTAAAWRTYTDGDGRVTRGTAHRYASTAKHQPSLVCVLSCGVPVWCAQCGVVCMLFVVKFCMLFVVVVWYCVVWRACYSVGYPHAYAGMPTQSLSFNGTRVTCVLCMMYRCPQRRNCGKRFSKGVWLPTRARRRGNICLGTTRPRTSNQPSIGGPSAQSTK